MKKVSVSFLSSKNPRRDLTKLAKTTSDYIHVDVIDNKFVKGKGVPIGELKHIEKYNQKPLDVHLMVKDAKRYIKKIVKLNVEYVTVHVESDTNIEKAYNYLNKYGIKMGLAINPETKLDKVLPYLDKINLILIMTVNPGKGGQELIEEAAKKVKLAKQLIKHENFDILISVDGGISETTKPKVKEADILVSGSYIINSNNYEESINILRK